MNLHQCYATRLFRDRIFARGPPASQIYPLMCPTENIHCIDERILVTKQRVLEPSISDRYFITKKSACVIIGACGGVIWAHGGVVSPKDKESKSVTDQSHSTTLTERSHLNSLIKIFTQHTSKIGSNLYKSLTVSITKQLVTILLLFNLLLKIHAILTC
jgi:hypothetical protein